MLSIALCDDDGQGVKRLHGITRRWADEQKIPVEIHCHSSGEALIDRWQQFRYDLIFLDIDMPGLNGIETARLIRERDQDVIIVFVTGYDRYVFTGYEVQAYRYVLKPISDGEMTRILSDTYQMQKNWRTEYITLNSDGATGKIAIADILYAESFGHTVNIVMRSSSTILWNKGLHALEDLLSGLGFLRCHRSYIVNIKHIQSLRDSVITLSDSRTIPVSRSNIKAVKTAILHQPL